MKNLSLKMTDIPLQKSMDVTAKNTVLSDGAAQAEKNASFQMMLNKQVLAKHASAIEIGNRQEQNKQTQKSTGKASDSATAKPESADTTAAQKNAQKASRLQLAMMETNHTKNMKGSEETEAMQLSIKGVMALDTKSTSLNNVDEAKASDETTALTDTNLADDTLTTNAPNLQMLSSLMAETKQASLGQSVEQKDGAEKQLTLDAERGSVLKDEVLSNALSKGKVNADAKDLATVDDKQSRHNWIDAMLPNASKQTNGDDAAKLVLRAEKESAMKEVAIPANYQSTSQAITQTSATEALRQLGSSNTINVYPGKAGWDQAISQKVVWMLGAQEQSATLTLNPPDMGPLQVVIHVHNDQADTTFISDNAEVRQALQDGMDNLRDKMNESGIQLGQANVSSGGQMQQQFQRTAQQSRANTSLVNNASASPIEHVSSAKTLVRITNGLVDTFA
jgi:flagellar hook-length control protein FliK